MSTIPTPQPYASSEPSKHKIVTHIAPDGTQYDVLAKRQHTSNTANADRAVSNAPSGSMTWLSVHTATSIQAAVIPLGTITTGKARKAVFSSEKEDDIQLTATGVNKGIHMDKDTNIHVQHTKEVSKGLVLSRKQQSKKATPAQGIPTSGESREMEIIPTPIGKHKLLASASAELLLKSNDDEKEFSELQNSQIIVANRTHNL